ncbi:MAG TPA: VOC family protein [Chitinophagaceae bacterium]|nr:VOC family protein [Chitinophagaceae bacterium]
MKRSIICLVLSFVFMNIYSQNFDSKARLNHIALYVTNLQTSTAFYKDVIGLDTIPEPFHDGRHTWFGVGVKSHLHIISGATTKTTHDKNTHLCFSVPSVSDFVKTLEKNKIEYEDWPGTKMKITTRVDGVKQIYFKDPDGYWIEINDAKE